MPKIYTLSNILVLVIQTAVSQSIAAAQGLLGGRTVMGDVPKFDRKQAYFFVSNHQSKYDGFMIFGSMSLVDCLRIAPLKSMTAASIYYTWQRPILYLIGCYPTRIQGKDIVEHTASMLSSGLSVLIFPEGRRTRERLRARSGVSRIVHASPEPLNIILVRLEWTGTHKFNLFNHLSISYAEPPANLNITDPESFMSEVYALPVSEH